MIFDLFLIVVAVAAIVVAVHYRAQAKAAGTNVGGVQGALQGLPTTMVAEFETMTGSVRAIIDHKFEALGKWLATEITKTVTAELTKSTVAGARPVAAVPEGPLAPITDDNAAQILKQMDAAIGGLTEKKAKLEGVLKAKQQADNALREVLGE